MHVKIVQVVLIRRFIFSCGQSAEPFLVEVYPQGINTRQTYVYAKVKLQLVDKEWLVQIPLHDVVLIRVEV